MRSVVTRAKVVILFTVSVVRKTWLRDDRLVKLKVLL